MRHFVAVLFAISVLILLVSPSLAAEKPYWGNSITYSMAFWSPLGWDDPDQGKNQVYSEENLKVCGYALRNWVNFLAVREVYFRVLAAPRVKTEEAPQPRTRSAEGQTGYDAKFVKMNSVPKRLLAGQVFYVEYTMKNTGNEGWGPDNEKHTVLRSREPDDNRTWGTFFITQGQGTAVPPGKEFTYRSWLIASSTPGEYVLQWQPAKWEGEGYAGKVTPFGEPTPRLVIQVQQRPDEPALPAPPSQAPGEKQVLAMDDFEYAGSFKIPDREGHDLPFSHSGLALRRMKDGTKRLFFNYTHPKVALAQVTLLGFDSTVFWPRTKRKSNDIGRFLSESRCSGNSTRTELVKC
jgi:hypothetical protein